MNISIVEATTNWPKHALLLAELDSQMFSEEDAFTFDYWLASGMVAFFIEVDGVTAGSIALELNSKLNSEGKTEKDDKSLHISSTGLLPEFRGKGLGTVMKAFEIAYARKHGFKRVYTNMRVSNEASLRLNKKFGFHLFARIPYYKDPEEYAYLMELHLPKA